MDPDKRKEKVNAKMDPSNDGLDRLKVLQDDALDDVNQHSSFYSRRPIREKVNLYYQLKCDREKRMIKPTQRFGYVDLISFALTTIKEI